MNILFNLNLVVSAHLDSADESTVSVNSLSFKLPEGVTYDSGTGTISFGESEVVSTDPDDSDAEPSPPDVEVPIDPETAPDIDPPVLDGHPKSKNGVAGYPINSINRLHDDNHPLYLWARIADAYTAQNRGWFNASGRAETIPKWQAIFVSNPFAYVTLHDPPLGNTPMFRTKDHDSSFYRYEWVKKHRDAAIVYVDHDKLDEISVNRATNSTSTSKQAGHFLNLAHPATAEYMAKNFADVFSGTNLAGRNLGGPDMSANIGMLFDGSTFTNPKSGARLLRNRSPNGKGRIKKIVRSDSKQPIIVELDKQPNLPTTGTLSEDQSFGAVDNIDSLVMQPPTQGAEGILGLHILGYRPVSGGNSRVYLKLLSRIAHSTQTYKPSVGDKWNITDLNKGTTSVDHDADGKPEDPHVEGHTNWTNGVIDFFDRIDTKLPSGNNTMRSLNTIAGSFNLKHENGLPVDFNYKEKLDVAFAEEMDNEFQFFPLASSGAHAYDTRKVKVSRGVRSMFWASQLIRPSPGGLIGSRIRGAMYDVSCWGHSDYDAVNELDAIYGLWHWALGKLVPNIVFTMNMKDVQGRPVMLEECLVDLDTNYTTPSPIATYDDGGGGLGNGGHPIGSLSFVSPDFGERGFIRRVGNWLIPINLTELPGNYPNTYSPDQGGANGYTPRNPQDTITPTDFAALEIAGVIQASDVLTEFNPGPYINMPMTLALRAASPAHWTPNLWYGPQQSHPDDRDNGGGKYVLSDVPCIARNTANDGSVVNRTANYGLGPLEARLWKIN